MKLAIMQPYFFPYLGYFQLINAVDEYILYDNLNFIKDAWMNRNKFLLKNGESSNMVVPLKQKSSFKKIYEIEIFDDFKWKKKILNSIFLNYKKTKYFEDVFPLIEEVVNFPTNKLTELNFQSIKCVCDYLDIQTKISVDCSKYNYIEDKLNKNVIQENDFPNLKLNDNPQKVVRVLEICKIENADEFINAIGGIDLYPRKVFLENGIDIKFIKSKDIMYNQFGKDFVPNLSIIDVMMFNSIEETKSLLDKYELV